MNNKPTVDHRKKKKNHTLRKKSEEQADVFNSNEHEITVFMVVGGNSQSHNVKKILLNLLLSANHTLLTSVQ